MFIMLRKEVGEIGGIIKERFNLHETKKGNVSGDKDEVLKTDNRIDEAILKARTETRRNNGDEQRCDKGNNESIIGNQLFNAKNGKGNEADSGQGSRNNKQGNSISGGKIGVGEQRKNIKVKCLATRGTWSFKERSSGPTTKNLEGILNRQKKYDIFRGLKY